MRDLAERKYLNSDWPGVASANRASGVCVGRAAAGEGLAGRPLVLYVQYTNPGAYPPLLHSARILEDAGWNVRFIGTESFGSRSLQLPPDLRFRIEKLSYPGESRSLPLHYLWFCLHILWRVLWWRPAWIYASDLFSYLPALVAHLVAGTRVVLHEHDSPAEKTGLFYRLLFRARKQLARRAVANVVPNELRARAFQQATGASVVKVVWNCPGAHEVVAWDDREAFVLYYHGTINPQLLPLTLVEALEMLPGDVVLRVVGYETKGSMGYSQQVLERARLLGIAHRVVILPPVSRNELLALCAKGDVGVALFPEAAGPADSYTGASNKVFDYLACGLPLLVSDNREWSDFFSGMKVAVGCNPFDPGSIAQAVRWFYDHRQEAREMGREGRERVLSEWNYEAQFAPVLEMMRGASGRRHTAS